jgi:hypothetical protein
MKKMLCVLLLATSGCYYQGYAVRRVVPAEPPLTREEVERLSAAGVSEPLIVEMVEKRGAVPLTPDDLVALKKAGTTDPVVQKMIATERKQPEMAVVDDYYVYPSSAYYYDYPYYHSTYSYGFGWGWGYYQPYSRGTLGVRVYR